MPHLDRALVLMLLFKSCRTLEQHKNQRLKLVVVLKIQFYNTVCLIRTKRQHHGRWGRGSQVGIFGSWSGFSLIMCTLWHQKLSPPWCGRRAIPRQNLLKSVKQSCHKKPRAFRTRHTSLTVPLQSAAQDRLYCRGGNPSLLNRVRQLSSNLWAEF